MNDDNIKKYDCETCCYRNLEADFCGFCMMKILDELNEKKEEKIDEYTIVVCN